MIEIKVGQVWRSRTDRDAVLRILEIDDRMVLIKWRDKRPYNVTLDRLHDWINGMGQRVWKIQLDETYLVSQILANYPADDEVDSQEN